MKRSPFTTSSAPVEEPLDPAIQAELDQLDAALRGEPITDESLAALVREIQATTPEMPSDLRKQLRHDVAEAFGRRGVRGKLKLRDGKRTLGAKRSGSLIYGGGFAATVLVLIGVGVALNSASTGGQSDIFTSSESAAPAGAESGVIQQMSGGSEPDVSDFESQARDSAQDRAAATLQSGAGASESSSVTSSSAPEADMSAAAPPSVDALKSTATSPKLQKLSPATSTPATGRRRVEQSVDMTVRVKNGKLDESTGKVEDIVRLGGGYVADSQVSLRSRGAGTATYTLKVASSKLDQTIKRLAELGTVTSQEQASRDITSSFDSVQQRLDDNKQVRAALLRALAKAETDGQIASLKSRLADNRRGRESLEAQLARLRTRTDLTTIQLALRAPSSTAADVDDDGSWSLGDAVSDAGTALGTVTGVLLVGAAVLLPFALIAAVGWAVYRVRRKRSRESALD